MSNPKFVPPIRFDLLRLIGTGQLLPIDLAVYQYLLAHSDNWKPSATDVGRFLGISEATYTRSMRRLRTAGLAVKGKGARKRADVEPARITRLGQYRAESHIAAIAKAPENRSESRTAVSEPDARKCVMPEHHFGYKHQCRYAEVASDR